MRSVLFTRAQTSWALILVIFTLCLGTLTVYAQGTGTGAIPALEATQAGFRQVHDKVAPAVVSITSNIVENDNSTDLYEYFFGTPRTPRTATASGSGVIIRKDGIVLTNSHVVANATKVTVTLSGADTPLDATVVQSDPRTDLAIVKITPKGDYPVATLGDASTVKVGDWAIAFGSPFRLATTMTVGVISQTGRRVPSPDAQYRYRDLLQTDASINPGNSGGALANIYGQVIGINFMIFSPGDSGGSVGIGFAIPINDYTKQVIETLSAGKAVERGRLGVSVKDLTDAMREQFSVKTGGVFVDSVMPGSAAEAAGIKAEDVITTYNGTAVTDSDQFVTLVERTAPGTKVDMTIVRDKKEQKVTATIAAMPTPAKLALNDQKVGMTVTTVTPELVRRFSLNAKTGVLVVRVAQGSPAAEAGLQSGDIIMRVGTTDIKTEDDFWAALNKQMAASQHGVTMRVQRDTTATTLTMPQIKME